MQIDKGLDRLATILTNDYVAFATQQITASTSVQALTVPDKARYALISVESDVTTRSIRYWENGSLPSASVGIIKTNGDIFDVTGANNLANFRFILDTLAAASAVSKLNVQYYK